MTSSRPTQKKNDEKKVDKKPGRDQGLHIGEDSGIFSFIVLFEIYYLMAGEYNQCLIYSFTLLN